MCYKQFRNDEPFKLNLSCKIIRENLYAIFALSNNSSTRNKSQILFLASKIYARWHLKKNKYSYVTDSFMLNGYS